MPRNVKGVSLSVLLLVIGLALGLSLNTLINIVPSTTITQTILTTQHTTITVTQTILTTQQTTVTKTLATTVINYQTTNETFAIIFRIDDIATKWLPKITKNITTTFVLEGVPLTLAIVPKGEHGAITEDTDIVPFLRVLSMNRQLVEIAQHGWNQTNRPPNGEFRGLSFEDQYNNIIKGKKMLDETFYQYNGNVTTLTVTYNVYDENTVRAAAQAGFKVFSSKLQMDWWDSFVTPPNLHNKFDKTGILYLDWNVPFFDENLKEPYPVHVTTDKCKIMLKIFGVCVILLHVQDFSNGGLDEVNERSYAALLGLIKELRKIPKTEFMTMRQYYEFRKRVSESVPST